MAEIELSIAGPLARLTLNSPATHNALTCAGMELFTRHLQTVGENPGVRVLVITGAGEKTFCAGVSLDQLKAGVVDADRFEKLASQLASLPIPKIAAMNGSAYGGGVEIGLCCDLRVGVRAMKVMVPAARFGLCYPAAGVQRYVDRLGYSQAVRLLVTAETLDDSELLRIGYLNEVVGREELEDTVNRRAEHIAGLAPLAVSAMLQMCDRAAAGMLDQASLQRQVDQCNNSADLREGLQAAIDKRKPLFRGR